MCSQDFSGWSFHLGLCGLPHSMGALRQSAYMIVHSSNTGVPEKVADVVSPCRPGLQSHAASLPCALWVPVTEVSRDACRGNGKQLQPVGVGGLNNWIPVVKPSLSHPSENGSLGGPSASLPLLILRCHTFIFRNSKELEDQMGIQISHLKLSSVCDR